MGPDALKVVGIWIQMFNLLHLEHLMIGALIFNTFFPLLPNSNLLRTQLSSESRKALFAMPSSV